MKNSAQKSEDFNIFEIKRKEGSISSAEMLKEIKENGFKNIDDEYVDRLVMFDTPNYMAGSGDSIDRVNELNRQVIKACLRCGRG